MKNDKQRQGMTIKKSSVHQRRNLSNGCSESWRGPEFTPIASRWQKLKMAVRLFFDLQTNSVWKDLKLELSSVEGTVLDVGCGAQLYRSFLPDNVNYIGIDISEAKTKFGYNTPETIYFTGNAWPVENQVIDIVLCTEVLEHVLDPMKFLSEAYRCLRPGGRLLLTVPFAHRWHHIPYDYWRFTPSSLKYLLHQAGFGKVAIYGRGNPVTVACFKVMALLFPLLLPKKSQNLFAFGIRLLGLLAFPLLFVLTCIANLSLSKDWGDDCLGYTTIAERTDDIGGLSDRKINLDGS